jgi:hypothetical protein
MDMKSGCKCARECVAKGADKLREYREGDRIMISKTGNVNVSFFKKSDPEKKFLNLNLGGDKDCSVFDLFVAVTIVAAFFSCVKCVVKCVCGK